MQSKKGRDEVKMLFMLRAQKKGTTKQLLSKHGRNKICVFLALRTHNKWVQQKAFQAKRGTVK